MPKIKLRRLKLSDKKHFDKWWRDKELLRLTSSILKPISDEEVNNYFKAMLKSKIDCHYIITYDNKIIGHISLVKRKNDWYETQIIIGEKKYWDKGYGTEAIKQLIKRLKHLAISRIFLEVRPSNKRAIRVYEKCGFCKKEVKKYPKNKYLPIVLRMELFF